MCFQCSRAKWLYKMDHNTKYYHLKDVNKKIQNQVQMLHDTDGMWVEDEHQVQYMETSFYNNLFTKTAKEDA